MNCLTIFDLTATELKNSYVVFTYDVLLIFFNVKAGSFRWFLVTQGNRLYFVANSDVYNELEYGLGHILSGVAYFL